MVNHVIGEGWARSIKANTALQGTAAMRAICTNIERGIMNKPFKLQM